MGVPVVGEERDLELQLIAAAPDARSYYTERSRRGRGVAGGGGFDERVPGQARRECSVSMVIYISTEPVQETNQPTNHALQLEAMWGGIVSLQRCVGRRDLS